MKNTQITRLAVAALVVTMSSFPAFAHHMMDGEVPKTLMQGLLSGLAHPVIGLDHLAFVAAIGVVAALAARPVAIPLSFIVGTALGCLAYVARPGLPFAELAVVASLVLGAAWLFLRRPLDTGAHLAVIALCGLVHGYAYGESILGAEMAPLGSYIVGFLAVQFGIAAAIAAGVRRLADAEVMRERTAAYGAAAALLAAATFGAMSTMLA